jgi:autotransporter passenger strand-loop-strand repeat protein
MVLSNGGGAWNATVLSGGMMSVSGGSVDVSATISSGGMEVLSGGQERFTTISAGGSQVVSNFGFASNTTIAASGLEIVGVGGFASSTTISAGGTETVLSGGETQTTIIDGGTLILSGSATDGITFAGTGGTLEIDAASAVPTTTISGFTTGDSIDFEFLRFSSADTYAVSGDVVTVTAGTDSYSLTIDGATAGGYELTRAADGSLTFAVCYYPGTMIRRPGGNAAVETLAIGDLVMTADGRALPVRWIGHNTVSTRFGDPLQVLPIRIHAGALGENLPERDLLVSPEHALLVADVLVQAGALVNGCSVVRERHVPETFVYYHVELSEHALILAEGTPAETFVDNVSRRVFDNWAEHEALYGDAPIEEMAYPRALSHRQVPDSVRTLIMARAESLGLTDAARVA